MATKKEPIQILRKRKYRDMRATFEYLVKWNDQSDDSWILESILKKQYPEKATEIINEWKNMGSKKVRNKLGQEMRLWSELPYASHAPAKPSIFHDSDSDDQKLSAGESIEEEEFPMSDLEGDEEAIIDPKWIDKVLGKRKRQYGGKTRKKRRKTRKKKRKTRKKKRKTRKKRRKKRRKTRKKKRR